jgi:hypothetical protein
MIVSSTDLVGDPARRQVAGTASSASGSGMPPASGLEGLAPQRPAVVRPRGGPEKTLEERLYTALADAKVWTSKIVMHMGIDQRDRYFRQLDLMHDINEWHGEDRPLRLESYQGFIHFMLKVPGKSKPALGLTPKGDLLAVWLHGDDRLTVEFLDREHVEWVVSRHRGGVVERAAGKTHASRLLANLEPYDPAGWFGS